MKILLKINDFIDVKYSTFFILLLIFLTGQFKPILIFLILSGIHELGHLTACLIFKVKLKKMTILPFGFNLEIENKISLKSYQEMIIYLSGPFMYFINLVLLHQIYAHGIISQITFQFAINANIALNLFNLLPIYPLDGFRVLNCFTHYLLPYKKSLIISLFISLFFFAALLVYNFYNPQIVITLFLFFMQFQFIKEIPLLYKKFLLSKTFNKKHKKFKVLNNYLMYKECNNYKIENDQLLDDKKIALKLLSQQKNK